VAFAGAAFFGGMKFQQNQRGDGALAQTGASQAHGQFQGNQEEARSGFRPVNGEIIAQDETSVTVKLEDGSSKIVILSDNTSINKASTGAKSDLKTGERVFVIGQENSDGSVTAQNIELNPRETRFEE